MPGDKGLQAANVQAGLGFSRSSNRRGAPGGALRYGRLTAWRSPETRCCTVARLARLESSEPEVARVPGRSFSAILEAVSQRLGARPRRGARDLASARDRQRLGRGRAAPSLSTRARSSRTRPTGTTATSGRRRRRRGDRHAAAERRAGARRCSRAAKSPPRELVDAYREAIEARDPELHAYLTRVEEPPGSGVPIALKDVISTRGDADHRRLADARELRAGLRRDRRGPLQAGAGLPLLGKTQHRRVRDGLLDRELRLRADPQPWDPTRVPGGSGGGSRGGGRRRLAAWGARPRTGGCSVKPVGVLRQRRACAPPTEPSPATAWSRSPGGLDQVGAVVRTVRDNALLYRIISGRDANDSTTVEVPAVELPDSGEADVAGVTNRRSAPARRGRGDRAGCQGGRRRRRSLTPARLGAEARAASCRCRSDYGLASYYLDRTRRGLVEPGPLRRGSLRAATADGDRLRWRW